MADKDCGVACMDYALSEDRALQEHMGQLLEGSLGSTKAKNSIRSHYFVLQSAKQKKHFNTHGAGL